MARCRFNGCTCRAYHNGPHRLRSKRNSAIEKAQKSAQSALKAYDKGTRRAWSRTPFMAEVVSIYFALIDPTVPARKKAKALLSPGRPLGYALAGAAGGAGAAIGGPVTAAFGAGVGATTGIALGELVNMHEGIVEPRHVNQALNYLKADSGLGAQWDYVQANRSRRNGPQDILARYVRVLAYMRALQWAYWVSHWQVKGGHFYGDHLLLQRLYEGFNKPIDQLAERIVGRFGSGSIDPVKVGTAALVLLQSHGRELAEDPFKTLLFLEGELNDALKVAWTTANQAGDLGLDDLLMGFAAEQDERIYLLRQRLDAKPARQNNASQADTFRVDSVRARFGRDTKRGYPLHVLLGGDWYTVGHLPTKDKRAAREMIRASQITQIRANRRHR